MQSTRSVACKNLLFRAHQRVFSTSGTNPSDPSSQLRVFQELRQFQKLRRNNNVYDPLAFAQQDRGPVSEKKSFEQPGYKPRSENVPQHDEPKAVVRDEDIHPVNITLLNQYISSSGKILPRWKTQLTDKQQRLLSKAVKRSRQMGLLPVLSNYTEANLKEVVNDRVLQSYTRVIEIRDKGLPLHTRKEV